MGYYRKRASNYSTHFMSHFKNYKLTSIDTVYGIIYVQASNEIVVVASIFLCPILGNFSVHTRVVTRNAILKKVQPIRSITNWGHGMFSTVKGVIWHVDFKTTLAGDEN